MWIRSQDKQMLIDVNGVYIESTHDIDNYRLYNIFSIEPKILLGSYYTKDQAEQILDKIEGKITLQQNNQVYFVFTMPEAEGTKTRRAE